MAWVGGISGVTGCLEAVLPTVARCQAYWDGNALQARARAQRMLFGTRYERKSKARQGETPRSVAGIRRDHSQRQRFSAHNHSRRISQAGARCMLQRRKLEMLSRAMVEPDAAPVEGRVQTWRYISRVNNSTCPTKKLHIFSSPCWRLQSLAPTLHVFSPGSPRTSPQRRVGDEVVQELNPPMIIIIGEYYGFHVALLPASFSWPPRPDLQRR